MDKNTTLLLSQLNALLRLTQTETMIAETRRAQATSERIERELRANTEKCNRRTELITEAIRDLGSLPDLVGSAVARAGTLAKLSAEQGQPLEDALLSDLLLEHQLLDRTRFARMLAEQTSAPAKVTRVLDRLEVAHTATIEWLMQRFAEIAVGGPPALRPSPIQSAVGASIRLTQFPARQAGIDRLRDPSQVRTVLAYEESNRNRKGVVEAGPRRPDGSSVVLDGNYTRPMTGGGGSTGLGGGGTGGTGGTRGSGCVGSRGSGVGDVPLGPSCRQNAWLAGSSCGWPCGSAVITWVTV